jgi:histidine triad (HIT) family protein
MTDCVFCKIVRREANAAIVYQDEQATAFRDARPAAPTHVLVVPNRHIASVNDLTSADEQTIGHLFAVARQVAEMEKIQNGGYRLIINNGAHGGQTVFHLHLHVLGGRPMRYPMG